MHTKTLKKAALALTFWLALHISSAKAQIFTNDLPLQADTTGTNPVDFEFRSDGTLIAKGNFGVGSMESGDQGDGTRMVWFPDLGAFRAGTVSTGDSIGSGPWDAPQLGTYSAAFGYNTIASGSGSFAVGSGSRACGDESFVMGTGSVVYGSGSTALGVYNSVSGGNSLATGSNDSANGLNSLAAGNVTTASGWYSTSLGSYSNASGYCSLAMGGSTTASGTYSTASGSYTTAASDLSFVIGTYNVGGGSANAWVDTDPLFEIGNGTSTTASDALVVYKNGNAAFQGSVTVAPTGDIPMYTGN